MNLVKFLTCCLAVLLHISAVAQPLQKEQRDTFYYDSKLNISTPGQSKFYRTPVKKVGNTYAVAYYYSNNNQLYYTGEVLAANIKGQPSIEPSVAISNGIFTYYNSEGKKSSEEVYVSGVAKGQWKEYYSNGNLKSVKVYEGAGSAQYVTHYYDDGRTVQSEGMMTGILKYGKMQYKREGEWKYYNMADKSLSAQVTFSAGALDGDVKFYDSVTGNLVLKGKYSLNMKSGQWTYYNPASKKRTAIINFDRGQPHGELYVFYPASGNLKQTGMYNHGVRNGLWSGLYDTDERLVQWQAEYKKDRAKIVYYDSANNDREIRTGNLYVHQRVGLWLEYHPENGRLKSKQTYNNNLLEGLVVNYDKNGVVTSEQTYSRGMKNGRSLYFFEGTKEIWTAANYYDDDVQKLQINYPSGKTKRIVDEMKPGIERSICFAEDGSKVEYCEPIETEAEFNGDVATYIGSNLKYPEEARLLKMEGQVKVGFTVDENGKISNPYIIEGFDSRCDEEALRLVAQMPAWVPASIDNTPVATNKILPIVFAVKSSDLHAHVERNILTDVKN